MKLKRISYEQATELFKTPVYYINAGFYCYYGPCSQCRTDTDDECDGGVFVVDNQPNEDTMIKIETCDKQGPSKKYAKDRGGLTLSGEIALIMVENEICSAEIKHPGWPTDIVHAVAIMVEEAGEAMQAALYLYYKDRDKEKLKERLITELSQTGAMAMRCLLHLV